MGSEKVSGGSSTLSCTLAHRLLTLMPSIRSSACEPRGSTRAVNSFAAWNG